jgi:hypothetical protein
MRTVGHCPLYLSLNPFPILSSSTPLVPAPPDSPLLSKCSSLSSLTPPACSLAQAKQEKEREEEEDMEYNETQRRGPSERVRVQPGLGQGRRNELLLTRERGGIGGRGG